MARIRRTSVSAPSEAERPARGKRAGLSRVAGALRGFARGHAVLCASAVLALATMAVVPPDAAYLGYFDFKVLACLLSILALVAALRNVGAFESLSRRLVARIADGRAAVVALVGTTLVLSMLVTNDMALIMMLPLATATLLKAGWGRLVPFTFVMQNMAANLGGMIVPFGNPQNLYLFEAFKIPLLDFLSVMAVPFLASCALIFACCWILVKPKPADPAALAAHEKAQRTAFYAKADAADDARESGGVSSAGGRAGSRGLRLRGARLLVPGERRARVLAYLALMLIVVAAVFRLVPYPAVPIAVFGALAVMDRSALRAVDYSLVLTFACFFVFSGNMARIPAVEEALSWLLGQSVLLTSAGLSQVISNVPAAILLSHVTSDWPSLLVGANVGGAGTPVASLATLITLAQYRSVCEATKAASRSQGTCQTFGRFAVVSTAWGVAFLAALLVVSLLCGF